MNEFTEEELLIINLSLSGNNYSDLKNKIQSMIDNYCDHNYKKTLDKSGMYFILLCHKCMDSKLGDGE